MRRSHATLLVATVLAMVTLIASVTAAGAFPSDTQKTGQPCGTCHVNPAGGGALTAAGQTYRATGALPAAAPAPAAPAPAAPAPAAPAPAAPAPTAPTVLPATGEGAVASALPGAVGLLGLFSLGLGYGVTRLRRRG
jgi:hypothetical protein